MKNRNRIETEFLKVKARGEKRKTPSGQIGGACGVSGNKSGVSGACGASAKSGKGFKNGNNDKNSPKNKKIIASVRAALSIIGAAVGAGFITGREILSFFGGYSPAFAFVTAFLAFFVWFYFLLCGAVNGKLAAIGNVAVYLLSALIIASMLGATDSLFNYVFGVPKSLPVGSVLLLVLCTALCFTGLNGVERANVILVPFMLLSVIFCVIYCFISENGGAGGSAGVDSAGGASGIQGECGTQGACGVLYAIFSPVKNGGAGLGLFGCISYCCLNALLSQPFFIKIKNERADVCPALTAAISAGGLSVMIFLYLLALGNKNVKVADIPVFLLCENCLALKYLLAFAVFCAIFTTQLSTEYPLVKLAEGKKASGLYIVGLATFAFALSRLGFFVMIDVIYPIMAIFATLYYAACAASIFAKSVFLKAPRRRTSARQARLKLWRKS